MPRSPALPGIAAAALASALALVACVSVLPAAAQLPRGHLVVSDHSRLLEIDPVSGLVAVLVEGDPLVEPRSLAIDRDGTLVVADWRAPTNPPGSLFRVDPATGAIGTIVSGPPFTTPYAVAIAADGDVLVSDLDAGTKHPLLRGGVFRKGMIFSVDPATRAVSIVSRDCCPWNASSMAIAPDGNVFATEVGCCAFFENGSLVRIDRVTGTFTEIPTSVVPLLDPSGLALDRRTGELIVTDATNPQPGEAKVLRVDPTSGRVETIASGGPLVDPENVALAPGGDLLVADSGASAVFRIAPDGAVTTAARGAPLGTPRGLALVTEGSTAGGSVPPDRDALDCETRNALTLGRLLSSIAGCWARAHTRADSAASAVAACREVGIGVMSSALGLGASCPACTRAAAPHLARLVIDGLFGVLDRSTGCDGGRHDPDSCPAAANAALFASDVLACRATAVGAAYRRTGLDLDACDTRALRADAGRASEARCPACVTTERARRNAQIASLASAAGSALYCARRAP